MKEELLDVMKQSEKELQAFTANLSDEARQENGTLQRWSAKDVTVHIATWTSNRAAQLGAHLDGKPVPDFGALDEANERFYNRNYDKPWPEVLEFLDQSRRELTRLARSLSEAELLNSRFSWIADQPLWMAITRTSLIHPCLHIGEYLRERNQVEEATRILAFSSQTAANLPGPDDWRALGPYNLACNYAVTGKKEQALELLAQAFRLNPALANFSRKDSDLVSLHGEPGYEALLAEISRV
jgi:tetratricopeptide (TPR) repeat protein